MEERLPTAYQGEAPYIFVSYAHRDQERVMPILLRLEEAGFRLWFDGGIDPGTEWDENIAGHIMSAAYFVAFMSENYINSQNCKEELRYARTHTENQLIAYLEQVQLTPGLAMRYNGLQAIHWYNYETEDDTPFERLYAAPGIGVCRVEAEEQPGGGEALEQTEQATRPRRGLIAAGDWYTVGLRPDGTVAMVGVFNDRHDVGQWRDIAAVAARKGIMLGVRRDGTAVAAGENAPDLSEWRDIVSIAAGDEHVVGLRSDGSVAAAGNNKNGQCDVGGWRAVAAVDANWQYTACVRADGTVNAAGSNFMGQLTVRGWEDIKAISCAGFHMVGVRSDGTVAAAGRNEEGQCNVDEWTDIVDVAAGAYHTVGLRSDGTVVAAGRNEEGQCNVDEWTDIVAIAAGDWHTVGLRSDGTVTAVGGENGGRCDVNGWKLF